MLLSQFIARVNSLNWSYTSSAMCIIRFRSSISHRKGMPSFGMDIGGTLTKLVYFETKSSNPDLQHQEVEIIKIMRRYIQEREIKNLIAGQADGLQMDNVSIGDRTGSVHFFRFPTTAMGDIINIAKKYELGRYIPAIGATGGGAYKFEQTFSSEWKRLDKPPVVSDMQQPGHCEHSLKTAQEFSAKIVRANYGELNIKLAKFDEMDTLLNGMLLVAKINHPNEVYYWYNPHEDDNICDLPPENERLSRKEQYDFSNPFPFIVVNIGSGVSILAVYSPTNYKRISGTSLGGGTFLGLCCLLTGCSSFEEAIALAATGDSKKVDKLVRDIYGGDYKKFGLPGDLVASSFGNMNIPELRAQATKSDIARATLVTITTNIGNIALMWAVNLKIRRVVFVGNFLRVNPISAKLLGYAMNYWSQGTQKALFLKHEGYFGAVGCLLELKEEDS